MKTVALVELNSWHSECLYSQVLMLKTAGYTVHLICNANLARQVADIKIADRELLVEPTLRGLMRVSRYICRNKIGKVVFNMAQGSHVLKYCLLNLFSRVRYFGTIHNLRKLTQSTGQKIISLKVKKYFVIAAYLKERFPAVKGLSCESFNPVFIPDHERMEIEKPENEIWIAIPGSLDFKRRDYAALFQEKPYDPRIRFVLIGNSRGCDGPVVRKMIEEAGLERNFILFDQYVENGPFYSYASACDYIMPLIHEGTEGFENYLRYKTTGTLLTALGLQIPMLCDAAFGQLEDFKGHALYYKREGLVEAVNALPKPDKRAFYPSDSVLSLEIQAARYAAFIGG